MTQSCSINCGNYLDIRYAEAFKHQLLTFLNQKAGHYVLVADKVERADSSGLQLVLAFMKSAEQRGIRVSWQRPSAELIKASRLLGLARVLNLDPEQGL